MVPAFHQHITRRACASPRAAGWLARANTCLCMRVSPSLCVDVCLRLGEPFGPAKTSAPSYVRGLVWHLGNILYPALQHYTQFTAKGHYVPVNPLLIDISANSTTSQPHDRSSPPQKPRKLPTSRVKIDPETFGWCHSDGLVCTLEPRKGETSTDEKWNGKLGKETQLKTHDEQRLKKRWNRHNNEEKRQTVSRPYGTVFSGV